MSAALERRLFWIVAAMYVAFTAFALQQGLRIFILTVDQP